MKYEIYVVINGEKQATGVVVDTEPKAIEKCAVLSSIDNSCGLGCNIYIYEEVEN